ncbi:MAG TPA: hypothetical protein VFI76_02950 [Terrimicrobiaceae bacterium]|nr:hypothetical protein [Terrimicrobiaceae bacterium]
MSCISRPRILYIHATPNFSHVSRLAVVTSLFDFPVFICHSACPVTLGRRKAISLQSARIALLAELGRTVRGKTLANDIGLTTLL